MLIVGSSWCKDCIDLNFEDENNKGLQELCNNWHTVNRLGQTNLVEAPLLPMGNVKCKIKTNLRIACFDLRP